MADKLTWEQLDNNTWRTPTIMGWLVRCHFNHQSLEDGSIIPQFQLLEIHDPDHKWLKGESIEEVVSGLDKKWDDLPCAKMDVIQYIQKQIPKIPETNKPETSVESATRMQNTYPR